MCIAATDLFPFLLRESVTHRPINWQSALIPSPSQELFFWSLFCRTDNVRESLELAEETYLSHMTALIPLGTLIRLYTPMNYFGRYATCSHKDGGRSIFSLGKPLARRTTWYAYNYVGARKFKSCVFEPLTRRVFSINTSSSRTLFLFNQFSSQRQHSLWPNFSAAATPCLADIHIQGLWDAFPSLRDCLFLTIEKGHFKLAILFVA